MTDKELLELAAKAAGIENLQWESDGTIQNRMNRPTIPYDCHGLLSATDWNPLTDDGDALRLAVKLGILDMHKILDDLIRKEQRRNDRPTATRRAIVRAAAEIGQRINDQQ